MISDLQDFIFENKLTRSKILSYSSSLANLARFRINVYRNHSFELIENSLKPFLDYAQISIEFSYSDYDDSLSFLNLDQNSDLLILWIDSTRYQNIDFNKFIIDRIEYLTKIYSKKILIIPFETNLTIENSSVVVYNLNKIKHFLNDDYLDLRLEKFSGTKLSSKALIEISKDLGLNYIPSILLPNIKALIFDLDNTLYKGVLGEDKIYGLELTNAHKLLQEHIVELSKQGFFICLASKNEEQDVIEMFKTRKDFPLQLEHITKYYISWKEKSKAVSEIIKFLNIGIDSVLFIDDNMGEIISMLNDYPSIKYIVAKNKADITLNVLKNYPRMLKLNIKDEDKIRSKDTQANKQREFLQKTLSKADYIKSLDIKLTYSINNNKQIPRISELANKTNQFICGYKRYSETEVKELMNDKNCMVITIKLEDKLSNSGIIGVCVFRDKNRYLEMEECFISCRALGRGIDNSIVLYPIQLALDKFGRSEFKINFIKGERNKPAENFLVENLFDFINASSKFNKDINQDLVSIIIEE
ncbi:HAD-IIIC family phosphatase [Campylobacter porcelli]|uniref:FkbH domain protein n=2 Tax=Campylobacter porcelli TaxID=1660073 RepID=A0A1X9SY67_9BACT|nr:HAD-IIIC family phosphatase [Campylobacter sp. RM6137]ARR01153.1 FkbH domain protein [Campylobacter sp. RM6137]